MPLAQVYRQACYAIWLSGPPQAAHRSPASEQGLDRSRPDTQQLPTLAQFRYVVRQDQAVRTQFVVRAKGKAKAPSTDGAGLGAPAVPNSFVRLLSVLRNTNALLQGPVISQTGVGKSGFVDAALREYCARCGPEAGLGDGSISNGPPQFGGGGEPDECGGPK